MALGKDGGNKVRDCGGDSKGNSSRGGGRGSGGEMVERTRQRR